MSEQHTSVNTQCDTCFVGQYGDLCCMKCNAKSVQHITLDTLPTAQLRPRHGTIRLKNGNVLHTTYKSDSQKAHESTLEAFLKPYAPKSPINAPVVLFFVAHMQTPMTTPKKRLEAMLGGKICHTKKPDLDNIAKQLKDAMTRLRFWQDDKQVVGLLCFKQFSQKSRWEIELITLDAESYDAGKRR